MTPMVRVIIVVLCLGVVSVHTENKKVYGPQWELIFRAVSGNGHPVMPIWFGSSAGQWCQCRMKHGCMPLHPHTSVTALAPKKHLRSTIIDNWAIAKINKVKLALYKDGEEVVNVIFNGKGSTNENWFSASRLLESSWCDMTRSGPFNVFSIKGYQERRTFHINKEYKGCPGDVGWLTVMDRQPYCRWDTKGPFPQFLYSQHDKATTWNKLDYGKADVLAVFVEVDE